MLVDWQAKGSDNTTILFLKNTRNTQLLEVIKKVQHTLRNVSKILIIYSVVKYIHFSFKHALLGQ